MAKTPLAPFKKAPPKPAFVVQPSRNPMLNAAWSAHTAAGKKAPPPTACDDASLFAQIAAAGKTTKRVLGKADKALKRATKTVKTIGAVQLAYPKEGAVESEPYRRLVAALPCAHCKIHGYSQAAHPPPTGKGIKADDRECFPLCCTRPGLKGCHAEFDQYELMPAEKMREQAAKWGAETRMLIARVGKWPKKLEPYNSANSNAIYNAGLRAMVDKAAQAAKVTKPPKAAAKVATSPAKKKAKK